MAELRGMFGAASTSGPKPGDDGSASASASRLDAAEESRRVPDASYFDQKVILWVWSECVEMWKQW